MIPKVLDFKRVRYDNKEMSDLKKTTLLSDNGAPQYEYEVCHSRRSFPSAHRLHFIQHNFNKINSFMTSHIVILKQVLNGKISSDLGQLEMLHEKYDWIPASDQIRPDPVTIEKKRISTELIFREWASFPSYVVHSIFGKQYFIRSDGLKEIKNKDKDVRGQIIFKPNEYPYNVGPEGNHSVLWFGYEKKLFSDDEINNEIRYQLNAIVGSDKYIFA
eukprot:gene13964-29726_t